MNITKKKETKLADIIRICYQEEEDLFNKSLFELNKIKYMKIIVIE